MFETFFANYQVTPSGEEEGVLPLSDPWKGGVIRGWDELFAQYPGSTFNHGIYRLHTPDTAQEANLIVVETFPRYKNAVICFSYDWLGRQFALDPRRMFDGEPGVLLIDLATRQAYEIDVTFVAFHNNVLIEDSQEALESHLFVDWASENQQSLPLRRNQIVGYRIPLTLGGQHEIANMVIEDMAVSLELDRQIGDAVLGTN